MNERQFILSQIPIAELREMFSEVVRTEFQKAISTPKPTADEYISVRDVSEIFRVSTVTVGDWTKKGILKSYRISSRIRYKRDEVLAALQARNIG